MEWGRTHLPLVYLALVTGADDNNEILKDGGPEIIGAEDFLSSIISEHVTTTGARMAVIQNSLNFLKC